jgi:alcohol dehydrogenase class IV
MNPFEYVSVPRIVFGCGQIQRLDSLARHLGSRALLVHNVPDELAARVGELLCAEQEKPTLIGQQGEPQVQQVDQAVEAARIAGCDMVIGLGGGSAIDAAKAVAGLLANGGSALDYMEIVGHGRKIAKPAVPWIAVPTTAGTGAEATRNAVIAHPPRQYKASIRSEHLLARVALIDPELSVALPADVTARCGMDALCQLIEAYTSRGASAMTDMLCLEGILLAARSLRRAHADGRDVEAREDMAMAALFSGIALTNAGLGAVHGLAAAIGANFPVPHGTVCAALLPHVIRANVATMRAESPPNPALGRYAMVGRALARRAESSQDRAIAACQDLILGLARELGIGPLRPFGISESHVAQIVALARQSSSMKYNPVHLTDEALSMALLAAI